MGLRAIHFLLSATQLTRAGCAGCPCHGSFHQRSELKLLPAETQRAFVPAGRELPAAAERALGNRCPAAGQRDFNPATISERQVVGRNEAHSASAGIARIQQRGSGAGRMREEPQMRLGSIRRSPQRPTIGRRMAARLQRREDHLNVRRPLGGAGGNQERGR